MNKELQETVINKLNELGISYEYYTHEAVPTAEAAAVVWKGLEGTFCKNLFFRNHKGNRHYLVLIDHTRTLPIRDLEQRLRQGKLSLASDERLHRYLGLRGGSVSVFGLINDKDHHVHVFVDEELQQSSKLGFHPNDNTATLVIDRKDFESFLVSSGNSWEYIRLT